MPFCTTAELALVTEISQIFADTFDHTQYVELNVDYYVPKKALSLITKFNLNRYLIRHVHGFDGPYLIDTVGTCSLEDAKTVFGELIKLNIGDE